MATAKFNVKIESNSKDKMSYELLTIITTSGFNDGKLDYTLIDPPEGVSIGKGYLIIDSRVYGTVRIEVSDGVDTAVAVTDIAGFYADVANMVNNIKYKEAITTIRSNWTEIVGR